MGVDSLNILSKEFLDKYSITSSLGRSLGNVSVSKLSEEDVYNVLCDLDKLRSACNDMVHRLIDTDIEFRIKSDDSVLLKIDKYKNLGGKASLCFNDLLGFRAYVSSFDGIVFPPHFRVVDLSKGKREDDGYRAIHLYYKKSNMHYQVEVQLWSDYDWDFNTWTHICGYKSFTSEQLLQLRVFYEQGKIKTYTEYLERVGEICQRLKWI